MPKTHLVGRPLQWAITLTSGAGFLLFGYDQGVMGGLLTGQAFTRTFPEIDTTANGNGSASLQGTVVAIYEIGCFFGAILAMIFGERLGRRWCIMIGCLVLSIGGALQAASYGIPQLIVGRIVAGLGNGLNTSTIPVWHSELSHADDRGRGVCIELAINIFGVMSAYWIDYGMSFVLNDAQFRFPLSLQCFFALVTFIGVLFLPESPRWLIAHDRLEEARYVLWSVEKNAKDLDLHDPRLKKELAIIEKAIAEEREAAASNSYVTLLRSGKQHFRYRTILGMGGQFIQQLSGINLITYYAGYIFEVSVGIQHSTALLLAGFLGIAFWVASLVPIWCIDIFGRRKLLLFAVIGQTICMAVLAGTVADSGHAAGIVASAFLFLFDIFFGIGLLAIPWLLPPEYAPLAIRTKACALATASNWIFTFLVVEITPVSVTNIGWRTYVYFAVFNFCFIPLVYFFYPETRRLSLEQIDQLFIGEKIKLHWSPSMDDLAGESAQINPAPHIPSASDEEKVGTETRENTRR